MLTASYEELRANEAEVSVIGSMLIDDRCIPAVMQASRQMAIVR